MRVRSTYASRKGNEFEFETWCQYLEVRCQAASGQTTPEGGTVRLDYPGVTPDQHIMRADLDERRRSSRRVLGDKSPKRKAKGV